VPLLSSPLSVAAVYLLAALAEIAGCFALWAWVRLGRSAWWALPGTLIPSGPIISFPSAIALDRLGAGTPQLVAFIAA